MFKRRNRSKRDKKYTAFVALCVIISLVIGAGLSILIQLRRTPDYSQHFYRQFGLFAVMVIVFTLAFIILFGILLPILVGSVRNRNFKKEYTMILKEYERSKDAKALHDSLISMHYKPRNYMYLSSKTSWQISLVSSLYWQEKYDEALEALDQIDLVNDKVKKYVKGVRDDITKKLEDQ